MRQSGGKWSESKLERAESYALRYLQVMQNQPWFTLHYVDAFAGRGKQALKSSAAGSAEARELESVVDSDFPDRDGR